MQKDQKSPFSYIEKVYRENYLYLKRFLIKLTSDEHLSEDIIQETFSKILRSPERLKEVTYVRSWLVVNVKNSLIDFHRKKYPNLLQNEECIVKLLIENDNPEKSFLVKSSIQALLNELSEEEQTIFLLKEYYGFKYEEISSIVSMPIGTVKVKLFRLKKNLLKFAGGDNNE